MGRKTSNKQTKTFYHEKVAFCFAQTAQVKQFFIYTSPNKPLSLKNLTLIGLMDFEYSLLPVLVTFVNDTLENVYKTKLMTK